MSFKCERCQLVYKQLPEQGICDSVRCRGACEPFDLVCIIDTETTGLDVATAELVEVVIKFGVDHKNDAHEWLLNPGIPIPPEATATHGIKDSDVVGCSKFEDVCGDINMALMAADVIVGYNPNFDLDIIKRKVAQVLGAPPKYTDIVICCKELWDAHEPRPKRDLQAAYREFVNPAGFDGAHRAASDVAATVAVLQAQRHRWSLLETPWASLDPTRAYWYGPTNHVIWNKDKTDLLLNFGKYQGKPFYDLDSGYLRWLIQKDFPEHVKRLANIRMALFPASREYMIERAKEVLS